MLWQARVSEIKVRGGASSSPVSTNGKVDHVGQVIGSVIFPTSEIFLVKLTILPCTQVPGVVAWVSAKDVPGENKVKGGASDSPVFADSKVEHVGQVIGLVIAHTPRAATQGAEKVAIHYGHPKVRTSYLHARSDCTGACVSPLHGIWWPSQRTWRACCV
jgi:hypothetical protein